MNLIFWRVLNTLLIDLFNSNTFFPFQNAPVMQRASQRQTRSLDNIVENPDGWRLHDRKSNSNVLFINEGRTTVVNEANSSNNHSETIEK